MFSFQHDFPPSIPAIDEHNLESWSSHTLVIKTSVWSMRLFHDLFTEFQKVCEQVLSVKSNSSGQSLTFGTAEVKEVPTASTTTSTTPTSLSSNQNHQLQNLVDLVKSQGSVPKLNLHPVVQMDQFWMDLSSIQSWGPSNPMFECQFPIETFPRNVLRFKPLQFTNAMMIMVFWAARNLNLDAYLVDLNLYDFDESDPDLFAMGRWKFVLKSCDGNRNDSNQDGIKSKTSTPTNQKLLN